MPADFRIRGQFVHYCTDFRHDLKICFFVMAADIIHLVRFPLLKDQQEGAGVVLDMEPVPDIVAFAVDRQWFAFKCVYDGKGNKFFRKLVWPIVVRAVGGEDRQTIGMVPCAHQVV